MTARFQFIVVSLAATLAFAAEEEKLFPGPINVNPPAISTDKSVRYDYDIVYVRAPRKTDNKETLWGEIAHPALMEPGADLMLLHPDGREELLVAGGEDNAVTDPFVSFDGESVYYSHIHGLKNTSPCGTAPPAVAAPLRAALPAKTNRVRRTRLHQRASPRPTAQNSKCHRSPMKTG